PAAEPATAPPRSASKERVVTPAAVEEQVVAATVGELLAALDPDRSLIDLVCGRGAEWWRCPRCGHRDVDVLDCVLAVGARCRRQWTRWELARRVLGDARAVARFMMRSRGVA